MDVGIDLGTTFSVLAVDGRVELSPDYAGGPGIYLDDCDVTVIPSPHGEKSFPSVMMQDPDDTARWLFGTDALLRAEEGFAPVMFSKRKMGTTEEIFVATGTVMAKEVAAHFLRFMKECAELALGQPVTRAVVTHPAYFDRGAVEETREAARQAGFDMALPQQMLMEPTAAALAYTRTDQRDPLRILTYDLGGGTFDVTYMERIDGVIQVRAFDGNHLLGGYNFDKELVRLIRRRLEEKGRTVILDEDDPVDRGRLARLLRIAESVKIELANTAQDTDAVEFRVRNVLVDDKGIPVQVTERVTRQQFVGAIRSWLDELVEGCRRAMAKAKAIPEDLHQILLVGGSSYGPWVGASLAEAFPNAERRLFSPDLCVGAGAAIHARMALPHVAAFGEYRIERDTRETSVLDHSHVAGRVLHARTGRPPNAGMRLQLSRAATRPQETTLGDDGRFLFRDVELAEDGATAFTLTLMDESAQPITEHTFEIRYVPPASSGGSSERVATNVTGSTTVLPRPLYIDTARGMVALAEEGVALPAKCVARFERTNSNRNITLRLFQEQDPVGVVRIENIPSDAGIGSPIELTIEVTADNLVQGDVVIYRMLAAKAGEVPRQVEALRSSILVSFDPLAIPSTDDLRDQFVQLKERVDLLESLDPYLAKEVGAECQALVARIERGFEHQPFERQEVFVEIRRLRYLLVPPKDDMSPSRRDFSSVVGEARADIEELRTTNSSILEELRKTGAADMEIDGRSVNVERVSSLLQRLSDIEQKLGDMERAGLDAHAQKDRIAWPKGFERVSGLAGKIKALKPQKKSLPVSTLPTPLLKILVIEQELGSRVRLLQRHAQALEASDEFADWAGELTDIMQQLARARDAVLQIDDDTPSAQAHAQIMKILERVRALDARIATVGKSLV